MKKEYSKPYLISEVFQPQEYCVLCDTKLSTERKRLYLDLDGNEYYDKGSEYMDSYAQVSGAQNGVYKNVQTYYLKRNQYENYLNEEKYWTEVTGAHATSCDYSLSAFKVGDYYYKFYKYKEIDVKIVGGKAYFNMS